MTDEHEGRREGEEPRPAGEQPTSFGHERPAPPGMGVPPASGGPPGYGRGDPPAQPPGGFAHSGGPGPPPGPGMPPGPPWPYQQPAHPTPEGGRATMSGRTVAVLAIVVALVAAVAGGAVGGWFGYRQAGQAAATDENFSLDTQPRGTSDRPPDSVAGIAERVLPSVVSVKVDAPGAEGEGAGFVIDDGYVITNNHVVARAADTGGNITLQFHNDQTATARIVGRSPAYDIAVLQPQGASGLRPVTLGDSDDVVVGDPVIAIGSPLGLSGTVTSGIVSAVNRPVSAGGGRGEPASYISAIQTDAAINPGNSGGPLVNSEGQVIGVSSAIATVDSRSGLGGGQGGNIGLGFAIPSNQVERVAEQIVRTGEASYPIIGAVIDLSYQGQGARILPSPVDGREPILPGGPAEAAGLRPGDVIVEFDGETISSADELIVAIRSHAPGDQVELTYRRGGAEDTVSLTLDEGQ